MRAIRPTVQAIDIGHGGTKFVRAVTDEGFACDVIESIAPAVPLRDSTMHRRDTVIVNLKRDGHEHRFEVGRDAALVLGHSALRFGRVLKPQDYPLSDTYMALARAAMFYFEGAAWDGNRRKVIDLLVLGLPMSTLRHLREPLAARMAGAHEVVCRGATYRIEVRAVRVVGQPIGGLIDWSTAAEEKGRIPVGHRVLLIDPGMVTVDAIVAEMTDEGFTDVSGRVAAAEGGAAMIFEELRKAIEEKTGYDVPLIDIQAAWTSVEKTLYLQGDYLALAPFADRVRERLEEVAQVVNHKVGGVRDINRIVIVGGAGPMYAEAIRTIAHRIPVELVAEPRFANVRGFQLIGELEVADRLATA